MKSFPSQGTHALSRRPIHTLQLAPLTLTQVTYANRNANIFYWMGKLGPTNLSQVWESRERQSYHTNETTVLLLRV